jgi:hypothetical protein
VANISSNPWSLTSADPATAAITSATLNADGTVTVVSAALTFNATAESNLGFTIIGAANPLYNGFYNRIIGASAATTFVLQPQFTIPAGTGASGAAGTLAQCIYRSQIRLEDISWQGLAGLGATGSLDLRDRSGNIVWQAAFLNNTGSAGYQNRGKVYWINGLTPITIAANTVVLLTID